MASLKERVDSDLKGAMRSKDELALSVLRMLKSAIKYKEVEPGAKAPDFEVPAHTGETVKLSDLAGKYVLLWFYPKADTPG